MRLLFIRHGDPDYEKDSLTETGWKEAALTAERVSKLDVKEFYLSPYGRAQDTASCTLKKMNRTGITLNWLREFWPRLDGVDAAGNQMHCWDWLPKDWTAEPLFYNVETWAEEPLMQTGRAREAYEEVCSGFDELLEKHGYVREENYYRVREANEDTLVFFCHFGIECVILSHLLHMSPMILWHGFCAAPASITTVYTEERREGIASFRISAFGDTGHLYAAEEEPSFAARFCECYGNKNERHD